jgi:hypothetical protein
LTNIKDRPCLTCEIDLVKEWSMATKADDLLPTASDFMKKLALAEAEEASEQAIDRRLGCNAPFLHQINFARHARTIFDICQ